MDIETWKHGHGDMRLKHGEILTFYEKIKQKKEAQAVFLHPFTVFSLCKRKCVVCQFVDKKQTNGSYPFANGLNGLAHLFYLFISVGTPC
jgi:hypothetical protein